jgi:type III secretion protein V
MPELEDVIRRGVQTSGGQQQLALDPAVGRRIIEALGGSVRKHNATAIVCAVDVRRFVRRMVEMDHFDTPVLSYHELSATLKLDVLDRVGVPRSNMLEAA